MSDGFRPASAIAFSEASMASDTGVLSVPRMYFVSPTPVMAPASRSDMFVLPFDRCQGPPVLTCGQLRSGWVSGHSPEPGHVPVPVMACRQAGHRSPHKQCPGKGWRPARAQTPAVPLTMAHSGVGDDRERHGDGSGAGAPRSIHSFSGRQAPGLYSKSPVFKKSGRAGLACGGRGQCRPDRRPGAS